jgi:hypothetical protein
MCFLPVSPRYTLEALGKRGPSPLGFGRGLENEKPAERRAFVRSLDFREIGAGEGIRTLDPNLGKVVLYP